MRKLSESSPRASGCRVAVTSDPERAAMDFGLGGDLMRGVHCDSM